MKTTLSVAVVRLAQVVLALSLVALLLGGCGGAGGLGGTATNEFVRSLQLGPQNYDLLTSLTPTLAQNWYTTPTVTPVTINQRGYADALKGAVYADEVRTGLNRYHLAGKYSALGVAFGVAADEPQSPSWTTFRFWGDGRELALPHFVKKGERRRIFVDVRGVQDFDLIAEGIPQTDGISYVSTLVGWGDGTLVNEAGPKYLVDLTPSATGGWTTPPTEGTIWINWHPFPHSLVGTVYRGQPAATVTYNLGGLYKTFSAISGLSQYETDTSATVTLQVRVDGVTQVSATIPQQAEQLQQLNVSGANTLQLRAQVADATEDAIDIGWGMALVAEN